MRGVEVNFADIVPLRGPVDFVEVLDVEFFAEGEDEIILGMLETDGVKVAHGNVHITRMNPPSVRMDRYPVR